MQIAIAFQNEHLDLEIPEERLIALWSGPPGVTGTDAERLVLEALENPHEYPPARQAVVPGDRVVIAFDPEVPEPRAALSAIVQVLQRAGVEAGSITVLLTHDPGYNLAAERPEGVALVVHDPSDRSQLAYLASTAEGRRIYLNRELTDADFVLPVGRLGDDPVLGFRGPWGVIFPGLSDEETRRALRAHSADRPARPEHSNPALTESIEVSWLLGSQLQVGIVPGVPGFVQAIAGLATAVRDEGARAVERTWSFRAESRAEVVVAGIGRPGVPTGIDELADGLATATRLVERGGKIVVLSRAEGGAEIGPAFQRLIDSGDPRGGLAALRGHEADHDFTAARRLARAVDWADVYLLSGLGPDLVDDLSMIPLERTEEAARLVRAGRSCIVVNQAGLTRSSVADEKD
jgi:nickel-dependent lactate racemase